MYNQLSAICIIVLILIEASENLVFLRISIPASILARVWWSCGLFFSFLQDQMWPRVWARSQASGSFMSSHICPRFSRTSSAGTGRSTWGLTTWSSQSDTWELKVQEIKLWPRLSVKFRLQKLQNGVGAFLIPSLWSLSCVGWMLWSILHKKDLSTEQRPFRSASAQANFQSTWRFLASVLQGLKICVVSAAVTIVTLDSISTLYHWPDVILAKFRRPYSFTFFIAV